MTNDNSAVVTLLKTLQTYDLTQHSLTLAGAFRWLSQGGLKPITAYELASHLEGFSVDVCQAVLFTLIDNELAFTENMADFNQLSQVKLADENAIQKLLELVNAISNIGSQLPPVSDQNIYWTPPMGIEERPLFPRLDVFLDELILSTKHELLIVAPYFSPSGVERLALNIVPLCRNRTDVSVNVVVDQLSWNNGMNFSALELLKEKLNTSGSVDRLTVFTPANGLRNRLSIHAKFLVCDKSSGFLGSANFTKGAMEEQLELGIRLTQGQSRKLSDLIDYLIEVQYLVRAHI